MKTIAFIIPPNVEILDLAGPLQVFTEAIGEGLEAQLQFYSITGTPTSTSGLKLDSELPYDQANLTEGDYIFIPGAAFETILELQHTQRTFF